MGISRSEDAEDVLIALGTPLETWTVVTPDYEIRVGWDEPPEQWNDGIEVEASSRRDAMLLAVKLMRQEPLRYRYFKKYDDQCPFSGLKVFRQ